MDLPNISNTSGAIDAAINASNMTSQLTSNEISSIELILIILIVAAIAFALIYFLIIKRKKVSSGISITFKIMDDKKNEISDSFLLLQKESGDIEFSNKVPSIITIPNLEDGRYSIKISKDGYETFNQTINLNSPMELKVYLVEATKGRSYSETTSIMKKIPQGLSVVEIYVKTKDGIGVNNAAITIGGQTVYTDNSGLCTLTLQNGEYIMEVEKKLCGKVTRHLRVEKNDKIEIILTPSLTMSVEEKERVQRAYGQVLTAFNEIHSGYDRMIPKYMKKVAEKVMKEIEKQSSNVNFTSEEEYRKTINDYIRSAEICMPIIASGMLERRNILLYAKLSEVLLDEKDDDPVDPPEAGKISISDAMTLLSEIDHTLIYEITNITIYPTAVLWKAAKKLLDNPNEANAHIAGIILVAAKKMLEDGRMRKRLEVTIL